MLKRREFLKLKARAARVDGYWLHVSRTAMACRFEVTLPIRERTGVRVARAALDEADRLERQLTVFRENSEVSCINRNAAFGPVRVEESLWALLRVCKQLHSETDAAFDITSAPLTRCWGFLKRAGRIPESNELEDARAVVGSDKLLLDDQSRAIRFLSPGVEINLGSIGKGYALDRMAEMMRGNVQTALLSAGSSSLLAIGAGDRRGWRIGIRHPVFRDKRLAVVRLRDCAMSTSGSEEQFFDYQGKRYGHIIDPRDGLPSEGVASATVIAPSAALTDALATAFYVGGATLAERYCAAHDHVIAIILEAGAKMPLIFGASDKCEVEISSE